VGYFKAVEEGMFVDSGLYPERNGDGIIRKIDGGIGANSIIKREKTYLAPVSAHYGYNNVGQYNEKYINHPEKLIGGSTLEDPSKIQYIDELDMEDNVNHRLDENEKYRSTTMLKPEVQWLGDGIVTVDLFFPTDTLTAEAAALEVGKAMNLSNVELIHKEILHPSEGTRIQFKGSVNVDIDQSKLILPKKAETLPDEDIFDYVKNHQL
jgi:D-ornithine 4,5-aminomutase subunit beta